MSQKPIDKRGALESRDAIWALVRKNRNGFALRDIAGHLRLDPSTIRDYLAGLTAAGYLEATSGDGRARPTTYRLISDCGVDAPRVRKDGTEITMGRGREQMWGVMRVLGDFSPLDLAVHASTEEVRVAEEEAKSYIHHLHKAGYLVVTAASRPGTAARYRLLPSRWSGPKPPMVQRIKQVWDPNLKRVVWSQGVDDDAA